MRDKRIHYGISELSFSFQGNSGFCHLKFGISGLNDIGILIFGAIGKQHLILMGIRDENPSYHSSIILTYKFILKKK